MSGKELLELSERDHALCAAMVKWIATVRASGGFGYGKEWLPTPVDVYKSRLFWRIRTGKEPLAYPPPVAYSCPWYELIEEPRPHGTFEPVWISERCPDKALICQCSYDIIERDGTNLMLAFGPYRFRAVAGENWIQRAPDKEASVAQPAEASGLNPDQVSVRPGPLVPSESPTKPGS